MSKQYGFKLQKRLCLLLALVMSGDNCCWAMVTFLHEHGAEKNISHLIFLSKCLTLQLHAFSTGTYVFSDNNIARIVGQGKMDAIFWLLGASEPELTYKIDFFLK
jgi:hypothetical protein